MPVIVYHIGIDLGLDGGLCFYDRPQDRLVVHKMPCVTYKSIKGKRINKINYKEVFQLLSFFKNKNAIVVFEKIQGIFGVSKKSACSFMEQIGHFKAFCIALNLRYEEVLPKVWQKELFTSISGIRRIGKGGKDKTVMVNDTKGMALQAFKKHFRKIQVPKTAWGRVLDGCIDAALISVYSVKTYTHK